MSCCSPPPVVELKLTSFELVMRPEVAPMASAFLTGLFLVYFLAGFLAGAFFLTGSLDLGRAPACSPLPGNFGVSASALAARLASSEIY